MMKMIMKNWISRRAWLASVVVLGLSAATAWADVNFDVFVPGVDANGALDGNPVSKVTLKVTVNTGKGTFTASGKGQVTNLFKNEKGKPEGVEFVDPPIKVTAPIGATVTSVLYKVDKKGKCKLDVAGYVGAAPPAPPAS